MTPEDRRTPDRRDTAPPGTLSRSAGYAGEPGCIAEARALADRFLTELAAEWLAPVSDRTAADVRLVVSELVTNADRHTGGPYTLELEGCARWLTVTVSDAGCARPVFHRSDPGRVGGHGMEIVRALSTRLSVKTIPAGKRVRAEFALAPEAGPRAAGARPADAAAPGRSVLGPPPHGRPGPDRPVRGRTAAEGTVQPPAPRKPPILPRRARSDEPPV
ncbi:ATP-binding protein [Streptomyces solincola]|uniref:ATP-binding protein n=1 Tax=Streptomyces solincola TaxID=2100817 RepID=UPI001C6159E1